jgi:sortase (surface protein transpeptidase)
VIIISTVFELKHRSTARQTASTSKQGETVQSAKHGVSEAEVGVAAYKDHRVANDYPRYLRIPKISVDARVIFSQTIKSDDMEPPANIHDISWYERSTKPGQEGVTMISGYAMGPTKRGVFNRLGSLKQNDQIELETGNGKKYVYKVVKLELYHKEEVDMEAMRMPAEEGVPALNILTFTERYDSRTQSSEKRMIVFTVLETILSE